MGKIKKYFKDETTTIRTLVLIIPLGILMVNILFYPFIPEDMPMQFTDSGETVYTLPKMLGIFAMPAVLFLSSLYVESKKSITKIYLIVWIVIFFLNIYVDLFVCDWI